MPTISLKISDPVTEKVILDLGRILRVKRETGVIQFDWKKELKDSGLKVHHSIFSM